MPNYEDAGLGDDEQYVVVVIASDDATGAGITIDGEDPIQTSMKTVTVTVEDMDELGVITTSPKTPMWVVPCRPPCPMATCRS